MAARQAYGQAIGTGGALSLQQYSNAINASAQQDRAHELNMRELEYMATRQALGIGSGGQGGGGGAGANADQFLQAWNQTLQASQGVYNRALDAYEGTYDWMKSASESASRLGDLAGQVETEYQQFRTDFAGTEQTFRDAAGDEMGSRQRMGKQLEGLATADYEGAAGQAMADVASQSEMGRQAEARRMQSLGIDPTSSRGRALMERGRATEAGNRAIAGNMARRGEKERVTGATATAMSMFDPTQMASMAMNIRGAGTNLLQTAGGLRGAETDAMGNLARTQANVATGMAGVGESMATTIGGQQADVAGLYAGLQYGNQNQPGATVPGGGGAQSTADMIAARRAGVNTSLGTVAASQPVQQSAHPSAITQQPAKPMQPAYQYSA